MTDDIETGPGTGDGNESLRDTIMSAVEAQTKGEEPAEEQPEEPKESSETRARDERGRFAAKDEPPAEPADVPETSESPASYKPPPGFSVQSKAEWDKLPEHIRADIAKRESEIDAGFKRYTGLGNFAEIAERNGRPLSDVVADYWQVEQSLRSNFLGGIEAICQRFGIDQRALAQAMAQRYRLSDQPQNYEGVSPLREVQQQQINPQALIDSALARFRQEQTEREVHQAIETFKADPSNRFFENVRPTMQALLAGGQAQTLKEAYDAACWLNPDTRAFLLAEQQTKPAPKTAAAIHQAKAAAKAVTGAPGPNVKPDSGAKLDENASVKDTIRAAIQAQYDAA